MRQFFAMLWCALFHNPYKVMKSTNQPDQFDLYCPKCNKTWEV